MRLATSAGAQMGDGIKQHEIGVRICNMAHCLMAFMAT